MLGIVFGNVLCVPLSHEKHTHFLMCRHDSLDPINALKTALKNACFHLNKICHFHLKGGNEALTKRLARVQACVCVCVRACVRACVCVCVCRGVGVVVVVVGWAI